MKNYDEVRKYLESLKERSAWGRGVVEYAFELLDNLEENNLEITKENALNGARDWSEYSYGGCSYIYDEDIAKTLCNNSELKRTDYGRLQPNRNETWLDVQSRALVQAWCKINRFLKYRF